MEHRHTTSECWHISSTHLSPGEVATLRSHDAQPLAGTPRYSSLKDRLIMEVPAELDPELPLRYPFLAACLAQAYGHGYQLVWFDPNGDVDERLPVHESQEPALGLAARRRLWLLDAIAWDIGVSGIEVEYARLLREVAHTANEPRVLLAERRQDAPAWRMTLHPDLSAAAHALTDDDTRVDLGESFVVDLETWVKSRLVRPLSWDMHTAIDAPLVCPSCGSTDVASAGDVPATRQGDWVQRGTERVFNGSDTFVVHWNAQTPDQQEACVCGDCDWSGLAKQLIPVYAWQQPGQAPRP